MSDAPRGPGWWQANDGKWYAPAPPQAPPKSGGGCLKGIGVMTLIGVGLLVVVVIIIAVALGGGDKDLKVNPADIPAVTVPGVDPGIGSQDATGDVTITYCGPGDFSLVASGTILNRSSKQSNYYITVAFESPDGTQQIDTGADFVQALAPGQSTTYEATSLKPEMKDTPGVTCRIVEVQRTAS